MHKHCMPLLLEVSEVFLPSSPLSSSLCFHCWVGIFPHTGDCESSENCMYGHAVPLTIA